MLKRNLFIIVALIFCAVLNAQEAETPAAPAALHKVVFPRFNMRASCTIPKVASSQAFRYSFTGVYDAQLTLNVRMARSFNVGIGYKNAWFKPTLYFSQKGLNTRLQVHDGFIHLAYDKIAGDRGFVTLGLDAGYSFNKYTNVKWIHDSLSTKYPTSYGTAFLRPEFSIYFMVEESFAFGFTFAYNYYLSRYDPHYNGFISYADSKSTETNIIYEGENYKNKANMGWFSFGFGFYYGFKKKTAG